ncbi:MAG: hypothetical protein ACE5F1_00740 [Planctomycetota bacterium]
MRATVRAILCGIPLLAGISPAQKTSSPTGDTLVVHEWGTFTSVVGSDGAVLDWRPLVGQADLPSFVYSNAAGGKGLRFGLTCDACGHLGCRCGKSCAPKDGSCSCKGCTVASIRMETPVLYFYCQGNRKVRVKVGFPEGRITEWFPKAQSVGKGIDWGLVQLLPGAGERFLVEDSPSHYYPARATDAVPVRICSPSGKEYEKFLFYRGVADFELPLAVTLEGDNVRLSNRGKQRIDQVLVFENRSGAPDYRISCYLDAKRSIDLKRPDGKTGLDSLESDFVKILRGQGLFEKEAEAMFETWRDHWFEEGLRVFYTVPRAMTDAVLPLQVEPKPDRIERVLIGRVEIITPEMEKSLLSNARLLGDPSFEVRERATRALLRYGRFAEPVLKRFLERTRDLEVKTRLQGILGS